MISDSDIYRFDLQGFLRLPQALDAGLVASCNAAIDALPAMEPGDWYGHIQRERVEGTRGICYQQIYEQEPFTQLIAHPAWIDRVRFFIGGMETFDRHYGSVFIDENFVSLRGPHEAIGLHSGGHTACKRTSYRVHNGQFMCMQVNVLIALTDIGPGDGATMVIPGSHKANFPLPEFARYAIKDGGSGDGCPEAQEVHMQAGDALLFTDSIMHGSAMRTNAGERRIAVFRYSPAFTCFRFGYRPSPELLHKLGTEERQMVWPFRLWERQPNLKADDDGAFLHEEDLAPYLEYWQTGGKGRPTAPQQLESGY